MTTQVQNRQGLRSAPLSFAQQRLWFIEQMFPGQSVYNVPAVLRLTGKLNVEALRQSLQEIVRRHGALRTTLRRFRREMLRGPQSRFCRKCRSVRQARASARPFKASREFWAMLRLAHT